MSKNWRQKVATLYFIVKCQKQNQSKQNVDENIASIRPLHGFLFCNFWFWPLISTQLKAHRQLTLYLLFVYSTARWVIVFCATAGVWKRKEMAKIICRICLRTDLQAHDIVETLVGFHDEITDYAVSYILKLLFHTKPYGFAFVLLLNNYINYIHNSCNFWTQSATKVAFRTILKYFLDKQNKLNKFIKVSQVLIVPTYYFIFTKYLPLSVLLF